MRNSLKIIADLGMFSFSLILAYWIRFDGRPPDFEVQQLKNWLFFVAAARVVTNWILGVYRHMWRYFSLYDGMVLAVSAAGVTAVLAMPRTFLTLDHQMLRISYGVLAIDFMIALGGAAGLRIIDRIFYEYVDSRKPATQRSTESHRVNVLLVGAGMAGIMVAKEVKNTRDLNWNVVGFVDDDVSKLNTVIHGVRVKGRTSDIPRLVAENDVNKVIVTIARASSMQIRRIVAICEAVPVKTQIIPGLYEILGEKVGVSKLRDVQIDDLLGRNVVAFEECSTEMSMCFRNKTILVSGAGGSIGSEICRQLALFVPRQLLLLDKDENTAFEIDTELRERFPFLNVRTIMGDLRNRDRMSRVLRELKPEVIFHAAAHKHVPLMEENVAEAINNNIVGTMNLVDLSDEHGVKRFVMLSTDKAVNCSNVMGATKRVAELYIRKKALNSSVSYSCVRFGNVLGSRGSVVPIFKRQILSGGPLKITHAEATRFFMTIPEASQLVVQAAAIGRNGEIFILDMGKPIRIVDLAKDLIHLSGLKDDDILFQYIGLRPGEKLHEELIYSNEEVHRTSVLKVLVANPAPINFPRFEKALDDLLRLGDAAEDSVLRPALFAVVHAALTEESGVCVAFKKT